MTVGTKFGLIMWSIWVIECTEMGPYGSTMLKIALDEAIREDRSMTVGSGPHQAPTNGWRVVIGFGF